MTVNPNKILLPEPDRALPGRPESMPLDNRHFVNGHPLKPPFVELDHDQAQVLLGLGCFWGAERKFWNTPGVYTTAVGYSGGVTPNPTYEEVCSGMTGHTEVVLVVYRPSEITFNELLTVFFEAHNPTQGMRQGNDIGTQYRSAIYVDNKQDLDLALEAVKSYQQALTKSGFKDVTTEVALAGEFFYAEGYHQQYLAKNPNGYCGIGGTGVSCVL